MNIAVIGAGISGLASAWLLNSKHEVSLYEAADYLGGHTNTVDVELDGHSHPVDTGFLVHNDLTYPNLIKLFEHLGVETYETDMSFSVQIPNSGVEWAGKNLATAFGQKRNLFRPHFLWMLKDILRFNRNAEAMLVWAENNQASLQQLLDAHNYSSVFRQWYLVPMAAAIWSSTPADILRFPATTFLRFCLNHHLLQIEGRPMWKSIRGGGRRYVQKLSTNLNVLLNTPVESVLRTEAGVEVTSKGQTHSYDAVIFATHAPDTLKMLAFPSSDEKSILGAVGYQANTAFLHTDRRFLPERESLWSAWNYLSLNDDDDGVCVTYWLNCLQDLPFKTPLMVTLNPPASMLPKQEIAKFEYDHPVFNQPAIEAQQRLQTIQGTDNIWYCGAWSGYGFHEDGLKSALRVVQDFDVEVPWTVSL